MTLVSSSKNAGLSIDRWPNFSTVRVLVQEVSKRSSVGSIPNSMHDSHYQIDKDHVKEDFSSHQ